ncbi:MULTISPECIES: methyltransferase [unclassified Pseudomonas]|uniref:methyltransferase n=1 Tax=unclassified Pseudomonas TaxID=196821 RepID=UPI0011EE4BF8|nr:MULTISPECIES: methyltransferase [unclassified Pseudomonas]KAA0948950.1 methyltransferase [Pseudomonas sp. ANT_H4]KAA0954272.1 methyltransferase [Pseudomonas sp. ANT_H14]
MPARDAETRLTGEYLLARFQALDAFLTEHQGLWQPRPFTHLQLPWEARHPELAQWLRRRSLAEAESSHNQPHTLPAPAPFPQLAAQSRTLSAVDNLPTAALAPAPPRLNVDVPGRKWQQIEAFGAALQFADSSTHWLDWCAGKGHLGRRLLQPGQQLTCLEYDPALIAAGMALSKHHRLPTSHCQQDVMAEDAALQLNRKHTPVALHACGDLHVRLMQLASTAGCNQMAVAPCCYNRISAEQYQPLSDPARRSALRLSVEELGLPLSETVTAGARVRQQRDISMARRLGFDQLQRQLRGRDDYLPTPSLPSSWLGKPFADYCQELAALKGLSTGEQDWTTLETQGWQRLAEVRNLELVRGLFRRPLEMWLVLDLALFLAQNGYSVQVGRFCETALTPRNLMVLAERDLGADFPAAACG